MPGRRLREPELIRLLYADLLDEAPWSRVLARLTQEFDSTYSVILRRDRAEDTVQITATDRLPRDRQQAYETYYAGLSPRSFFFAPDRLTGKVLTDRSYDDYQGYLRSEIYHDFFRPLRADHLMFAELRRNRTEQESVVVRRDSHAGFYDEGAMRRFARLCRHLGNAACLLAELRAAQYRAKNYGALVDTLGTTAFLTDRGGAIRYMTETAERLVRDGTILTLTGGRLTARRPDVHSELQAAIRDCTDSVDHPEMPASRTLRLRSPEDGRWSATIRVSSVVWTDPSGRAVPASLVIVDEPSRHRAEPLLEMARLLGLTPAESRLAVALCDGRSLSEHAVSAGISILTARTLLKRAREKTRTHSQAELVSLLLRSVPR